MTKTQLPIKEIIQETHDAVTLKFQRPGDMTYLPGQYLTLIFTIDGQEVRRCFSICTSPKDTDIAVTVKRLEGGLVSNYVIDNLKAGDKVDVLPPEGHFTIAPDQNKARELVMIAGGSGITPVMSMIRTILQVEPRSKIVLVYCNKTEEDIIFKSTLVPLAKACAPRFQVFHTFSRAQGSPELGETGRLTEIKLRRYLTEAEVNIPQAAYYLCGPTAMMDMAINWLDKQQVGKDHIFQEKFYIEKQENEGAAQEEAGQHTVTIILDGEEYQVEVPPDKSILESALDADLDMPFSCQSGICTTCRGIKKSGELYMDADDGLMDEEIAEGHVLTCQSHPLSDDVVIEMEN